MKSFDDTIYYMEGTFWSQINSACLTAAGPRIFKLQSKNFNILLKSMET